MEEKERKPVKLSRYRLSSGEFLFILQRIDNLEDSLRQEIKTVETGLRQEIKAVDIGLRQEMNNLRQEVNNLRQEMKGFFWAVVGLALASLAVSISVAVKIWQ